MDNKNKLIEKATGWALALFLYGTGIFYFATKVMNLGEDELSAYVSLLGVGATLFTGFIAIYLFNDWKEQHNKSIISSDAKSAFNKIHLDRYNIQQLNFTIKKIENNNNIINKEDRSYIIDLTIKLIDENNKSRSELASFLNLSENIAIFSIVDNYFKKVIDYNKWIIELQKNDFDLSLNFNEFKERIVQLMKSNQDTLDQLRKLVFIE